MENLQRLINNIVSRDTDHLFNTDFLLTWEKSMADLEQVLDIVEALKSLRSHNIATDVFKTGLAISQFRDNSTRTRFSFTSAANLLGLALQDLEEGKSQIAHGETIRETVNMISFLSDIIGIRDDMYLGAGNKYMREVGAALDDGFAQGVLPQRPGIINLQCDIDHPTQSMADLAHLKQYFGSLEALKGKKLAMTWAYSPSYGKPLSVPQGIIGLLTRFGMEVELAYPEGYGLIPEVMETAARQAKETGGSFKVVNSMDKAFKNADIVYPKSWAPYAVMGQRTELLRANDSEGLKTLEQKALLNNAKFMNWEADAEKMKLTKNGSALYMHCLPADISGISCERGEVSADVFEKYRIETYKEAGYKPYVIAAMMLSNRYKDPGRVLSELLKKGDKRKM
ncbi:MAG: knotted carbamoyltransferase YgeW [Bacteroidales bacterium]|nr:knotted carbamoyltransferase YgeW [Bacteroidales bacterium]